MIRFQRKGRGQNKTKHPLSHFRKSRGIKRYQQSVAHTKVKARQGRIAGRCHHSCRFRFNGGDQRPVPIPFPSPSQPIPSAPPCRSRWIECQSRANFRPAPRRLFALAKHIASSAGSHENLGDIHMRGGSSGPGIRALAPGFRAAHAFGALVQDVAQQGVVAVLFGVVHADVSASSRASAHRSHHVPFGWVTLTAVDCPAGDTCAPARGRTGKCTRDCCARDRGGSFRSCA